MTAAARVLGLAGLALALASPAAAQIRIEHVTIAENEASEAVGGLWLLGGDGETTAGVLENTLIGDNEAPEAPDCERDPFFLVDGQGVDLLSIGDAGGFGEPCLESPPHLVGTLASPVDPGLLPLADYGGETPTHALLGDSPAVDAAPDQGESEDQRTVTRPQKAAFDIGAFELRPADLAITKTDSPDPVPQGGLVTYTVTATNLGPDVASGITIVDTLPTGLTFQSATPSAGGGCTTPPVGSDGGTVTCDFPGSLDPGGAVTVGIVAGVPADAVPGSSVVNQAEVSSVTGDPDPDPTPNLATETTRIAAAALALTKTDSADPVMRGGTFSYLLTAENLGPDPAEDVEITDTLPSGLTFQSATPSAGGVCVTPAVGSSGGTVTCTFAGTTAVDGERSVAIVVGVPLTAVPGSTVVNQAAATTATDDTGGAVATESTRIAAADLLITKSARLTQNDQVLFTVTVENLGPDAAQDVTIVDALPAVYTFVSATPSAGGSCTTPPQGAAGGTITCTFPGATAVGVQRTVEIAAVLAIRSTVANVASVSSATGDPVPDPSPNEAQAAPVIPIPTVGEVGLLLLMLALGAAGALALRPRAG